MHGAIGCGKTCAALAMADRVTRCFYYGMRELADALLAARDGNYCRELPDGSLEETSEGWLRWSVDKTQLLIMDELGTRKAGDFELATLHWLLDKRVNRPTILLSNQPLYGRDSIAELYDARVADRIRGGTVIHYPGDSRRGKS
jgi:DNA replication protein DnaC